MTTLPGASALHSRAVTALSAPVSGLSLAVFRIALGGLLVWGCWRFIAYDRIYRYWVQPELHFTYPGFGWVAPLPEPLIYHAWLLVGVTGALVMLGLFYRVAIVVLTMTFGYFFLLDKAEYLNHFYLVLLFLALMCVMPAHRMLSVDAWLRPSVRRDHVPCAAAFMLRTQLELVRLFAGLVKLTPDWLADGIFYVTADGQTYPVDPTDHLTRRQAGKMLVRTDMIHQFARHLEIVWQEAGYTDIEVRADIRNPLNGRPMQPFVVSTVDLTAVPLARAARLRSLPAPSR